VAPPKGKRNWRLSAFEVERRQVADLRTLIEIAQGKHDARTLAQLAHRNIGAPGVGGRGMIRHLREERWPNEAVSELDEFRRWLLGGLWKMFEEDGWRLSASDPEFSSFSIVIRAQRPNEYEDPAGAAAPRLVAWRLVELHKWRLKQCAWPKCDKPGRFFVTHKKSAYCGPRHAQNARTWRYRHGGADPEQTQDSGRKS
jgi:hypothetical protein